MSRKRIIAMMLAVFACSLAACSIPNAIEEEYSHESIYVLIIKSRIVLLPSVQHGT